MWLQFRSALPQSKCIVAVSKGFNGRKEVHGQLRISIDISRVVVVRGGVLRVVARIITLEHIHGAALFRDRGLSLVPGDELTNSVMLGFQVS